MRVIIRTLSGVLLITGLLVNLPARGAAKACGGEGPTPLHDISHQFFPKFEWIETRAAGPSRGGVQDFIFWESLNTLVFRTPADLLRRYSIDSGYVTSMSLMDRPIAQLSDGSERYVVTDGNNMVYDTGEAKWTEFVGPTQPLLHLFWRKNPSVGEQLYTLSQTNNADAAQVFTIHRYTPQTNTSEFMCSFTPHAKGARFKVARGTYYPHVLFWTVETGFLGKQTLYTYRMNVEKDCTFKTEAVNVNDYPGRIQDVYQFRDIDSLGVKMNHEKLAFMYKRGPDCKCYNTGNLTPLVLDAAKPTLAIWQQGRGLDLMNLPEGTKMTVAETKSWKVTDLTQKEITYSPARRKLFLSPLFQGEPDRRLVQVELNAALDE